MDDKKKNEGIKLDDTTLEDIEVDLSDDDQEDQDKVRDFYDYDSSIFDFKPIGTIGDDEDETKTIKNPLKKNRNLNINLFDDDKQRIYDSFNQPEEKQDEIKKTSINDVAENVLIDQKEMLNDAINEEVDEVKIKSLIESALYVYGDEGLSLSDLKKLTCVSSTTIKKILKKWIQELEDDKSRGLIIKMYGDRYKFFSKAQNREHLSKLITIRYKNPLSMKVVETLAIIAYNQPCTRGIVESIRGKDSTFAIQKLIQLELIQEVGRANEPGRPLLYEVTHKFYDIFGIKNVKDLPIINLDQPFQDDDISFFDTTRFND